MVKNDRCRAWLLEQNFDDGWNWFYPLQRIKKTEGSNLENRKPTRNTIASSKSHCFGLNMLKSQIGETVDSARYRWMLAHFMYQQMSEKRPMNSCFQHRSRYNEILATQIPETRTDKKKWWFAVPSPFSKFNYTWRFSWGETSGLHKKCWKTFREVCWASVLSFSKDFLNQHRNWDVCISFKGYSYSFNVKGFS